MVHELAEVRFLGASINSHSERHEAILRFEGRREAPAYNLTRVDVCHKVKIGAIILERNIGDVAHPQFINPIGGESFS